MTEINDRVKVSVTVSDTLLARASFSTVALIAKHGNTAIDRVVTFSSLESLNSIFESYTPVGVAGALFFGQKWKPDKILVIYRGDSETVDQAMDAALAVNPDFYFIVSAGRDNTTMKDLQDWATANNRFAFFSSEDVSAPTSGTTDPFYYGKNLSYNRVAGWFHKKAGRDIELASVTITGTTATATLTSHGVSVGDYLHIWDSTSSGLLGKHEVLTVPTADTLTFTVPAGTVSDSSGGIKTLVNGYMVESALLGLMASTEPGRRTFDLQTLSGIPADSLNDTEKGYLAGKEANYYVSMGGVPITSGLKSNGFGGHCLSGRNIDLQWFIDWFATNVQVDIAQVIINAGGELAFDAGGLQKIQTAIETRCRESFDNKAITTFSSGPYAGQNYVVTMPLLKDITSTDRGNGILKGIKGNMLYNNKIKGVELEVNISI